ncbi:hypothetical protein [Priestia megaterium]|uniref:hypothetical protein n=1 Tax=Priestia megaterium TaxID=1404 RepID=UPI0023DCDAE5|nr:hypothetical protein [Priestia megaterium]MDF2010200.1 hypothetical protein [Priestia megaterium]
MIFDEVKEYVDSMILHSESFDSVDEKIQRKAINNAEALLYSFYKRYNPDKNPLPVEAVAYQAIYMLNKDDSDLRAEKGVTYIGFNGVAMNLAKQQRTISPDVIRILGRRVGSYTVTVAQTNRNDFSDTFK